MADKVFNRKFAGERLYLRNIMFEKHNNWVGYGICRQERRTTLVDKRIYTIFAPQITIYTTMDIKLLLVEDDPNLAYIIRSGL